MQVGLIGLGKMGFNLGQNLLDHHHTVVAYDLNPTAVKDMKKLGAQATSNLGELVQLLGTPRVLWIMVPHTVVDTVLAVEKA